MSFDNFHSLTPFSIKVTDYVKTLCTKKTKGLVLKVPKSQNVSFEKIEFENLMFLKEITILKTSCRNKGTSLLFFLQ